MPPLTLSVPTTQLVEDDDGGHHTEYLIVSLVPGIGPFSAWRRFKEFDELRGYLTRRHVALDVGLLPFPSKFQMWKNAATVAAKRRGELETWLQTILERVTQRNGGQIVEELRSFLSIPESVMRKVSPAPTVPPVNDVAVTSSSQSIHQLPTEHPHQPFRARSTSPPINFISDDEDFSSSLTDGQQQDDQSEIDRVERLVQKFEAFLTAS